MSNALTDAIAHVPRTRLIAGSALLAITVGIVGNALFLQPRQHPAPYFSIRDEAPVEAEEPDELVRAVQDALKQIGYYSGPLDGLAGPQTRSAIVAFEARADLPQSGEATLELLTALRSTSRPDLASVRASPAPPPQPSSAPAAQTTAQTAAPEPLVAAIQQALARAAYGPLTADGVIGPATTDAIMRFQRDHDLPVTGEISDALVVELRAAGAMDDG